MDEHYCRYCESKLEHLDGYKKNYFVCPKCGAELTIKDSGLETIEI